MKFLVPNYSCLQNPWLGGYRPQIPVLSPLCPQLNLLNPPTPLRKQFLGTPLSCRQQCFILLYDTILNFCLFLLLNKIYSGAVFLWLLTLIVVLLPTFTLSFWKWDCSARPEAFWLLMVSSCQISHSSSKRGGASLLRGDILTWVSWLNVLHGYKVPYCCCESQPVATLEDSNKFYTSAWRRCLIISLKPVAVIFNLYSFDYTMPNMSSLCNRTCWQTKCDSVNNRTTWFKTLADSPRFRKRASEHWHLVSVYCTVVMLWQFPCKVWASPTNLRITTSIISQSRQSLCHLAHFPVDSDLCL